MTDGRLGGNRVKGSFSTYRYIGILLAVYRDPLAFLQRTRVSATSDPPDSGSEVETSLAALLTRASPGSGIRELFDYDTGVLADPVG